MLNSNVNYIALFNKKIIKKIEYEVNIVYYIPKILHNILQENSVLVTFPD